MSQSPLYLVTGAAGFIGARFVESCSKKQIPVIVVDKRSHFDTRPEHEGMVPEIPYGTIVDRDELAQWLEDNQPRITAVLHIGACSSTMETREDYLRKTNVEYSKALWNYATKQGIPFVYASSAATYGDGAHGYDDDETRISLLKPLNLYGQSKQTFDLWALDQEKAGNHPPAWAGFKFFNVFGFGERHKGRMASVVLHSFDQILAHGKVKLFRSHKEGIADGHQMRDFVAVEDVIEVLHFAVEKPIRRGIYNLGSGKARTFLDLTRAVFAAMGRPENIEFIDTPENIRDKYQYFTEATMTKLRDQGYSKPFHTLEEAVKKYVDRLSRA